MVFRKSRIFRGRSEKQLLNGNIATAKPLVPAGWSITDTGGGGGGGAQTPWASNIDAAGFNITNLGTINGVKIYRALLTQSGTDAPVAIIQENTLGGVPVWSRDAVGEYYITLAGAFPAGRSMVFFAPDYWFGNCQIWAGGRDSDDTIASQSFKLNPSEPADLGGGQHSIMILVKPA